MPQPAGYSFGPETTRRLLEVANERAGTESNGKRSRFRDPAMRAIIFLIPSGGIAARDGTTVSSATCTRYELIDGTLTALAVDGELWNCSEQALAEGEYIVGIPDYRGQYIYESSHGMYIAKAPVDGIPPAVLGYVSTTTVDLYKRSGSQLIATGATKDVYNIADVALATGDNKFIIIDEDRFNDWYVIAEVCSTQGNQISGMALQVTMQGNEANNSADSEFTLYQLELLMTMGHVTYNRPYAVEPS